MLKRLINTLEKTPITVRSWVVGFLGIIFVRFLLENLSSPTGSGILGSDASTLVHYYLFYLSVALSLILVIYAIGKQKLLETSKIVLFGLVLVWLAPILDFILSGGNGFAMAYLLQPPSYLLTSFMSFFGPFTEAGITPGIRIEVLLILCFIFYYVKQQTESFAKALSAFAASYAVIFFWVALPSFVAWGQENIAQWFFGATANSFIAQNFLHGTVTLSSPVRELEVYFNVAIGHVYFFALLALVFILAYSWNKEKLWALLQNSRPRRVVHYLFMVILGGILAVGEQHFAGITSVFDYTSLIILLLSFYFSWMFAVGVNDMVDQKIDAVSNAKRPLISGVLTRKDMASANVFFFIAALVGGFLVGHYAFFMVLAFTALYYIYSAPPLQLKRLPILNSFIISLCALSVVLAGFFTVANTQVVADFPMNWVFLLVLVFTLAANMKDIKDIAGDRAAGIQTLPVLLGEEKGKRVVGAMVAVAFFLVPYFTGLTELWFTAVVFAPMAYVVINRKVFVEKQLFHVYFFYITVSLIALAL